MSYEFANDILERCQIAQQRYDGRPNPAWSTGEQLAVALVLNDHAHLERMGYTILEACDRVRGGMWNPPTDFLTWLDEIRTKLDNMSHRPKGRS